MPSLVVQMASDASFSAVSNLIDAGSIAGISVTWAGGLTGASRPRFPAQRLVYVDVQTKDDLRELWVKAEQAGHKPLLAIKPTLTLAQLLEQDHTAGAVAPLAYALEAWVRAKGGAR